MLFNITLQVRTSYIYSFSLINANRFRFHRKNLMLLLKLTKKFIENNNKLYITVQYFFIYTFVYTAYTIIQ